MTSDIPGLDFYLSEMAISDRHGGGLTLQRVLGNDILGIAHCFHVARFAQLAPPIPSLRDRSVGLWSFLEDDVTRAVFGSRPTNWCFQRAAVRRLHARRAANVCAEKLRNRAAPMGLVCPQGLSSLLVVKELRRRRNIRYVTWVMDDHLVRWSDGRLRHAKDVRSLMQEHLSQAADVAVISPAMRDFYRDEFGVESQVIFGPAPDTAAVPRIHPQGGRLRIGYFGAVNLWQLDALVAVARVLPRANATLDIYTAAAALPPALALPGVQLFAPIASADVPATMARYDAIVLPIGFSDDVRHLTMLNIATKMSECLASGTVTLAVGPRYAAMMEYLASHGAALWVDTLDEPAMEVALAALERPEVRTRILDGAAKLVKGELSMAAMHAKWRAFREGAFHSHHGFEVARG